MTMSETTNNVPPAAFGEDDIVALSARLSDEFKINDFVWIENPEDGSNEVDENTNTSGIVAQYYINSETSEETLPCDSDSIEISKFTTEQCDRECLVDQHYWDQHGPAPKINNGKFRQPTAQRMSIKLSNAIAARNAVPRDPSYFNLDKATTALLAKLVKEDYMGRLHNVAGKGNNSVVIHADCAYSSRVTRVSYYCGIAVKVRKLGIMDKKKNIAILKQTQREYDHLLLVNRCSGSAPWVLHKKKNVIIMLFEGENQQTDPSISDLPADRSEQIYRAIIGNMKRWYKEAHLVHGRLSDKKIIFRIYTDYSGAAHCSMTVIGWSHSVKTDHPEALRKLMRDCLFVTKFFESRNVKVKPVEKLFKKISGLDKISNKVQEVLNPKGLWHAQHPDNPNRIHSDKNAPIGNSRFK